MSQELTLLQGHLRQLSWSGFEALTDFILLIVVTIFVAFSESELLSSAFEVFSFLILAQVQSWIVTVSNTITGSEAASTSSLLVFWSVVGAALYFIYWIVRRVFYDAEDSYLEVFRDVHPASYSKRQHLVAMIEHHLLFIAYAVLTIVYGFIWANRILQPIVEKSIEILNLTPEQWYLLLLFPIILVISAHVFAILWRFLRGKQYVHFI